MARFSDWFSKVFSGTSTRGLSGDMGRVVLDEGEAGFYTSHFRMHRADADLVSNPEKIWNPGSSPRRAGGLLAHLRAECNESVASFTDIAVILSRDDFSRTQDPFEYEDRWIPQATRLLSQQIEEYTEGAGFKRLFPNRPFNVVIFGDGGPEMGGTELGLEAGQFLTGLAPNLYSSPAAFSRPVIALHLNIPGEWEGYKEVGRLFSDQILFTLGTHWLDNFSHPALRWTAIYRLQQQPDGSLVHMINPEVQDHYVVGSTGTPDGPAVLTISELGGEPIAYLVLAVLDTMEQYPEQEGQQPATPQDSLMEDSWFDGDVSADASAAPTPRDAPAPGGSDAAAESGNGELPFPISENPEPAVFPLSGHGPVAAGIPSTSSGEPAPNVAESPVEPSTLHPAPMARPTRRPVVREHMTIIPDAMAERILTLKERGVLLQKVHFNNFMKGYDVYVSSDGKLGTAPMESAATFEVRGDRVYLSAHITGVRVGSRKLVPGKPIELRGNVEIVVGGSVLEYSDLSFVGAKGWPYLGEIRREASSNFLVFGGVYRIGRDRACKVRLPDEPQNENIVWRMAMKEGDTIRSRTGSIPKSRFYNDSIMVASQHAELDLGNEPRIRNVARHCYTYIRRGDEIITLYPTLMDGAAHESDLSPGDQLLVGNSLFEVGYPLVSQPTTQTQQDVDGEEPGSPLQGSTPADLASKAAPPPYSGVMEAADAPVARGLGEDGPAPPGYMLASTAFDSVMGVGGAVEEPASPPSAPIQVAPGTSAEDLPGRTPPTEPGHAASLPSTTTAAEPASRWPVGAPDGVAAPSTVTVVDEDDWQLELSRPARFRLVGWMISGETLVGNHEGAGVVIPENRTNPGQTFQPIDYFSLRVRGRRGRVTVLSDSFCGLSLRGETTSATDRFMEALLEIPRFDEDGEEDFRISMTFKDETWLPDPRARMLALNNGDRLVEALFLRGLPLRATIGLQLGTLSFKATFNGSDVVLADYLDSYRGAEGRYKPFFIRRGDGPARTVPEDGSSVEVQAGDYIICDRSVYRLEAN